MKTYLVLKPLVLTRKGEGFVLKSLLWKYPEEEGNAIKEQTRLNEQTCLMYVNLLKGGYYNQILLD